MRTNTYLASTSVSVLLLLSVAACGSVGDAPQAELSEAFAAVQSEGRELPIDTARSSVNWRAAKITRAHEGGFKTFQGVVMVEEGAVSGARVEIDARSIWSDNERLTTHLKSPDFFDVETHPSAVFESVEIVSDESEGFTHLVTGNLTMHGVANGVRFPATIHTGSDDVHVEADFIIDRTRWGITYTGRADDLIDHEVRLIFDIHASATAVIPVTAGLSEGDSRGGAIN